MLLGMTIQYDINITLLRFQKNFSVIILGEQGEKAAWLLHECLLNTVEYDYLILSERSIARKSFRRSGFLLKTLQSLSIFH